MSTQIFSHSRRALVAAIAAAPFVTAPASAAALTVQFWATRSGGETLDAPDGTGNPFATQLIALLNESTDPLPVLAAQLCDRTRLATRDFQIPETAPAQFSSNWQVSPRAGREKRVALVLTNADYSASDGAQSLPGAARDGERMSDALARAGFTVTRAPDVSRQALPAVLRSFARASARADVALLYSTGHGVEVDGVQYSLFGDHRVADGVAGLSRAALWSEIAASARARKLNLTVWAGCRNNPFA
jgi:Caspase domain